MSGPDPARPRPGAPGRGPGAGAAGAGGREDGGVIVGWLVRLACLLAVGGLAGYDGLAIGVTELSLRDHAPAAARAASAEWQATRTVQHAYEAAVRDATRRNPRNMVDPATFAVDSAGTVRVRLARDVETLVLRHVPQLRPWTTRSYEGTGRHVG